MFPFSWGAAVCSINSCRVHILMNNLSLNIGCTLLSLYYHPEIICFSSSKPYQFKIRFSALQLAISVTNFVVVYNNCLHAFCCSEIVIFTLTHVFSPSEYFRGCVSSLCSLKSFLSMPKFSYLYEPFICSSPNRPYFLSKSTFND